MKTKSAALASAALLCGVATAQEFSYSSFRQVITVPGASARTIQISESAPGELRVRDLLSTPSMNQAVLCIARPRSASLDWADGIQRITIQPAFAGCPETRLLIDPTGTGWEEEKVGGSWQKTGGQLTGRGPVRTALNAPPATPRATAPTPGAAHAAPAPHEDPALKAAQQELAKAQADVTAAREQLEQEREAAAAARAEAEREKAAAARAREREREEALAARAREERKRAQAQASQPRAEVSAEEQRRRGETSQQAKAAVSTSTREDTHAAAKQAEHDKIEREKAERERAERGRTDRERAARAAREQEQAAAAVREAAERERAAAARQAAVRPPAQEARGGQDDQNLARRLFQARANARNALLHARTDNPQCQYTVDRFAQQFDRAEAKFQQIMASPIGNNPVAYGGVINGFEGIYNNFQITGCAGK